MNPSQAHALRDSLGIAEGSEWDKLAGIGGNELPGVEAALDRGERPDPTRIRPEEFYNAFNYGDPAPGAGEKIAARIERLTKAPLPAAHPARQVAGL